MGKQCAVEIQHWDIPIQDRCRSNQTILTRVLYRNNQGVTANKGWASHLTAIRALGKGHHFPSIGTRGGNKEHPVAAKHPNQCADIPSFGVINGRWYIGRAHGETILQIRGHIRYPPDIALGIEDQIVYVGKPCPGNGASLTALNKALPSKGESGAVSTVFNDFVESPRLLGAVDAREGLGNLEDMGIRIAIAPRCPIGVGDENFTGITGIDLDVFGTSGGGAPR